MYTLHCASVILFIFLHIMLSCSLHSPQGDVIKDCFNSTNSTSCSYSYEDVYNSLAKSENNFNISYALYPGRSKPPSFRVFVNVYGPSSSKGSSPATYTWTLSCLYAAIPAAVLEFFSLGSILVTPRTEELNLHIPQFCCNLSESNETRERIIDGMLTRVLAELQDLAVSPRIQDPRLNTAECVIQGHQPRIDALEGNAFIREILWCSFLSVMVLGPMIALFFLGFTGLEKLPSNKMPEQGRDQQPPHQQETEQARDYQPPPHQEAGQARDHQPPPHQEAGQARDHQPPPHQEAGQARDYQPPPQQEAGQARDHQPLPQQEAGQARDHQPPPHQEAGQARDNQGTLSYDDAVPRSAQIICHLLLLAEIAVIIYIVIRQPRHTFKNLPTEVRIFYPLIVCEGTAICAVKCLIHRKELGCRLKIAFLYMWTVLVFTTCSNIILYHFCWLTTGIMLHPTWGLTVLAVVCFVIGALLYSVYELCDSVDEKDFTVYCFSYFAIFVGLCFLVSQTVLVGRSFYGKDTADEIVKTALFFVACGIIWLLRKRFFLTENPQDQTKLTPGTPNPNPNTTPGNQGNTVQNNANSSRCAAASQEIELQPRSGETSRLLPGQ